MSTLIIVDTGNSAMKVAAFEGETLLDEAVDFDKMPVTVANFIERFSPQGACYCCVGEDPGEVAAYLDSCPLPVVALGPDTPLPIAVDYDRRSLGVDRIAAAVGVSEEYEAAMLIDAGTAVTIDLVADKRFVGGNISPGLKLRFRSLHKFTSRLPLVSPEGELPRFGYDTETAIRAGVVRGLAAEIAAAFEEGVKMYPGIQLVLTGGDAALLEPFLRTYCLEPSADPQVVGRGLVRIFKHNM